MQYTYDSIHIRELLTKFRSAYWSRAIFGEGVPRCDILYGGGPRCV